MADEPTAGAAPEASASGTEPQTPAADAAGALYDNPSSNMNGKQPGEGAPAADGKEGGDKPGEGQPPTSSEDGEKSDKGEAEDGKPKDDTPAQLSMEQRQEIIQDAVSQALPKDMEANPVLLKTFGDIAQRYNIPEADIREIVATHMQGELKDAEQQGKLLEQRRAQAIQKTYEALVASHHGDEAKAKEAAEYARRGVQQVADAAGADSASLLQKLESRGLGNDPDMVKAFSYVGRLFAEDSLVIPGVESSGKTTMDIFYDNSPGLK
jgi:hypothetical protein